MPKNYIDIRIALSYETETYTDDDGVTETERFLDSAKVKVIRTKGLTPEEINHVAESFGDSDKYQLMLSNDTVDAISEASVHYKIQH